MRNLITAQEVIDLAFAENSNMMAESISETSIHIAEIKYIRPAFGVMYPLLADKYADFTNDYVKPALAYFVKCEIVSSIAIDMSNSGVAVANPQYQSAATDKQRQRLYDSEMSKAKTLLDFALEYIAENKESFPDFSGEAPKKHHRVGGILLGGGTSCSQSASIAGEAFKNEIDQLSSKVDDLEEQIGIIGTISADMLYPTTYAELKALRDAGELIPGMMYRITDYVTIIAETATVRSAGHPFDLVVTALDERTLSEEASAMLHEGDEYFATTNLSAWRVWYSLGEGYRSMWVSGVEHKGIIYRLIDDKGNDVCYDFKNIQFNIDGEWCYTFDYYGEDGTAGNVMNVHDNKIDRDNFGLSPLVFYANNELYGNIISGVWTSAVFRGITRNNNITFTSACNLVANGDFNGNQLSLDKDLTANDDFTKNRIVYLYTPLTANAKVYACQFDVQQRNSVPLVLNAGRLQDCQFYGTGTFTIANSSGDITGTMSFSSISLGMNGSNVKLVWNKTASLNNRIEGITLKAYNWGTSEVVVDITNHPVNATYPLTIAKNKNGEVKIFCEADLA